jgi:hypothetical protein
VRLVGIAVVAACSSPSPSLTTDTDSGALAEPRQRVEFVGRYVRARSPISDAEFVIRYHDNSAGVPGPSDWDVRAVLQVADPAPWAAGWQPCAGGAPAWATPLLDRHPAWRRARTAPRCFRDPRHRATQLALWADDHLVAYRSASELGAD